MNNYLIIRIKATAGEENTPMQWARTDQEGNIGHPLGEGDWTVLKTWLSELPADQYKSFMDNIILLLPGTLATFHAIAVNASQKKHMDKVVPFLMEENLAADIDAFHFVHRLSEDNHAFSCVIPEKLMEDIIQAMSAINLEPSSILAENQLFFSNHVNGEHPVLYIENRYVHAYFPESGDVRTLEVNGLMLVLDSLLATELEDAEQQSEHTPQIDVYCSENNTETREMILSPLRKTHPDLQINEHVIDRDTNYFPLLSQRYFSALQARNIIDFRSGRFTCYKRIKRAWKKWKMILFIAIAWLCAELALNAGMAIFYQYKASRLEQETLSIYTKAFPKDNAVVDVKTSLQRKLRTLQGTAKGHGFMDILKKIPYGAQMENMIIRSIDYNKGDQRIVLDVVAPDYERLNGYVDIARKAGLSITLAGANNEGKNVIAKLIITR